MPDCLSIAWTTPITFRTRIRIYPINFLQYSDAKWDRYADNRYMYMNRLRHDDFLALFHSSGHKILATEPAIDIA